MANDRRWSSLRLSLWRVLDRVATIAVLVAAIVFLWNGGPGSSRSAPAGQPTIPIPEQPISLDGIPVMGSPLAKVALVEFSDFQCPYCGRFAQETLPALKAKYVDTGLVRFVFRHNPIPVHTRAQPAAEAAECAGRQGHFWGMHDRLFEDPTELEESNLADYAKSLDLDLSAFDGCRAGGAREPVLRDAELARSLSLRGTPTFLIGPVGADGRAEVSDVIAGARPVAEFEAVLDKVLKVAEARN